MFHRFVWTAVLMSTLALGAGVGRAEEERHGKRHGGMHGPCMADVEKLCKDAKGDRAAMRKCLKEHEGDLSDRCKKALEKMKKRHGEKPGGEAAPV
jgi:hypothetical protein